jgi:hypothetical protein
MLKRIYFSKLNSTKLERMADIPMKNVTYRQFSEESYTEAQIKKGRPVSPHITIYKFPITAISSISNRATGIVLSIGNSKKGIIHICILLFLFRNHWNRCTWSCWQRCSGIDANDWKRAYCCTYRQIFGSLPSGLPLL